MVRQTRQLIHWWLHELRFAAAAAVHSWRHSPEWPLLAVSKLLLASSASHWLGLIFAPTEWEGRTGWRKPMLIGVSNAMVFGALAKGLAAQSVMPRATSAHAAAWSTAVEVAVITVQSWRGQPSHFNTSTRVNAALYAVKLTGVTILGVVCLATAAGCVLRCQHTSAPDRAALRCGLLLLSCAVLVGFGLIPQLAQVFSFSRVTRALTAHPEPPSRGKLRATAVRTGVPCGRLYHPGHSVGAGASRWRGGAVGNAGALRWQGTSAVACDRADVPRAWRWMTMTAASERCSIDSERRR